MSTAASFCDRAWQATAPTRAAIEELGFLSELAEGVLPEPTFAGYLVQDAHYLREFGRALCLAGAKADRDSELSFFASAAAGIITVEMQLHRAQDGGARDNGARGVGVGNNGARGVGVGNNRSRDGDNGSDEGEDRVHGDSAGEDRAGHHDSQPSEHDPAPEPPSPTCTAYTSFLLATAATQGYAELVAAVLPCFWVYADVGVRILELAGDLTGHPYADWIRAYADPDFDAQVDQAKAIADRIASASDEATVARMHAAFATAVEYERQFWQAAYDRQDWGPGGHPGR